MTSLQTRRHPMTKVVDVPVDNSARDVFYKTYQFHEAIRNGLWENQAYMFERTMIGPMDNRVRILDHYTGQERHMIMMAGNDYLGLSNHPRLVEAARRATEKYGIGTLGSTILTGMSDLHVELEDRLARMVGCEAASLFSSGYAANLGAIGCLTGPGDAVVNDTTNHASIIDGSRFSGADFRTFRHNNVTHLERVLAETQAENDGTLVVVDSVFSMDGDLAPVPQIVDVCRKYGARLMIDEAHSTGVLGQRGFGTSEHFGVEGQVDLVMGSLSKGVGVLGAFVAGSAEVVHYLRLNARSRVFSYSLSAGHVAAILEALDIIEFDTERRANLWRNIDYMHRELRCMGFDIGDPHSAVIPVMVHSEKLLWPFGRLLHDAGIFCNPIVYPAVAKDKARIRLSLRATHTQSDLDETLTVLEDAGRATGLL
jgi:8-amino-7-oxononanoate synthase